MIRPASRSIPSLDGLRAVSVALVVFAHTLDYLPGRFGRFIAARLGLIGLSGVNIFFVISGFLITSILLREQASTGRIRLGNFYFRRFFRIFPPFYAYLAVVGILCALGLSHVAGESGIAAATYTFNYAPHWSEWLVAHTWSLSLEEQFYLLWPPCLLLLGRRKSVYAALGVVACSPLVRVITRYATPRLIAMEWTMLHTRLDTLMCGCLVALLWDEVRINRPIQRFLNPALFAIASIFVIVLSPYFSVRFAARYDWTIGYTLQSVLIALMLAYVVNKPDGPVGRFLNARPIRHIGVISYSLYLWQQMFTGPRSFAIPLNLIAVLACAELSYWLIEQPSLRLRDRLERSFSRKKDQALVTAGATTAALELSPTTGEHA